MGRRSARGDGLVLRANFPLAFGDVAAFVVGVSGDQPENEPAQHSAPRAKMLSPTIRSQRSWFMPLEWRNSDERAYQVPYSTDAHACIRPMGKMLIRTISASPMLMAQNAKARGAFFHALPGRRARRQNNIKPSPSMP